LDWTINKNSTLNRKDRLDRRGDKRKIKIKHGHRSLTVDTSTLLIIWENDINQCNHKCRRPTHCPRPRQRSIYVRGPYMSSVLHIVYIWIGPYMSHTDTIILFVSYQNYGINIWARLLPNWKIKNIHLIVCCFLTFSERSDGPIQNLLIFFGKLLITPDTHSSLDRSVRSIRLFAFLRQIDFTFRLNCRYKTLRVGAEKSKCSKPSQDLILSFSSNGQPEIRL
jgi:hypothetical protein